MPPIAASRPHPGPATSPLDEILGNPTFAADRPLTVVVVGDAARRIEGAGDPSADDPGVRLVHAVGLTEARAALDRLEVDAALVTEDLVGRAFVRAVRGREPPVPVVCITNPARRPEPELATRRRQGTTATVPAEGLGGPLLTYALRRAVETVRLARALLDARGVPGPGVEPPIDPLTGLPTKAAFLTAIHEAMAGDPALGLSVVWLDVDRFREIDASLGHPTADALLQAVAERIRSCVGPDAVSARWGGDQFRRAAGGGPGRGLGSAAGRSPALGPA